ncbi:MAG: flagellar biosynthetic protein FliO [Candidatus Aureabacteria bacterium]|nr:flagellar biosynthetic protein FliO [Candidatus Auribacterota bacterium]
MMKKTIHLFVIMFIINIAVDFLVSDSLAQEVDIQEISNETVTLDKTVPPTKQEVDNKESSVAFTLDDTAPSPVPTFDVKKTFVRMMISLVIILLFIFLMTVLYKKFFSSSTPFTKKGRELLRVIEKFPLGPKNYLMLVWVIDRIVLMSFNNGTIEKISEFKADSITGDIERDIFQDSLQREMSDSNIEEVVNV